MLKARGFTLVELMVVIAVIGIASAAVVLAMPVVVFGNKKAPTLDSPSFENRRSRIRGDLGWTFAAVI